MSLTAFERYAPFIQEYIYKKQWTDLREVQVEACDAILDTDNHVIIASGTASGKTEAAFFPILTLLQQKPSKSIGVLYIGPLKALINDQFERLNGLLEESYIPVYPWHGDVSQSLKKRAMQESQGILQITPESLEALLMLRSGEVARMFSDLRFIVIDEIHALMGTDRGLQVLCLISRLEQVAKCAPRRIGLSATLNDYEPAMRFLSAGTPKKSLAVGISHNKRKISLCIDSYIIPSNEKLAEKVREDCNNFIYDNCHNQKCLIFTNSRGNAEKIIADMKSIADEKKQPDIFYVHHGSVSATLRQDAEAALRNNEGATVTAATLTLELGIDIGDLDSTMQIGAPYTCASFVQRLGRSGRRTGKSQMLFIDSHEEKKDNIFEQIPWDLLRIIAIIQLYLEERWVEPFDLKPKPFSLLAHQTLSVLATYTELSPPELAKKVLLLPPFKETVTQDEYKILLRNMVENDYIQRMDEGNFILGLAGERIVRHYSFYAVFQDEQAYHVQSKDGEVGTLDSCPEIGEAFVLAGRTWLVQDVDIDRKIIFVSLVKNKKIPTWNGSGGHIHTKIVQRMKQVLAEDINYPYLLPSAIKVLEDGRKISRESGMLKSDLLSISDHSFFLCPWVGSKTLHTVKNLLAYGFKDEVGIIAIKSTKNSLLITTELTAKEFIKKLSDVQDIVNNPKMVLPENATPKVDKYDTMVPDELLIKAYFYNELDVNAAINVLRNLQI